MRIDTQGGWDIALARKPEEAPTQRAYAGLGKAYELVERKACCAHDREASVE